MQKNKSFLILIFISILLCISVILSWSYGEYLYFNRLYQQEKYTEIINIYAEKKNLSSPSLHNIGNTYFRLYQSSEDETYLFSALEAYSGSLRLFEHEDTRFNYEFIKNIIEQTKENQQSQQEEKQDSQQENAGNQQQESEDSPGDEDISQEENQASGEANQGEEQYVQELSDEEKQQLREAAEQLQREQVYNQKFFGKQQQASDFFGSFESFFGEIERGGEKDW